MLKEGCCCCKLKFFKILICSRISRKRLGLNICRLLLLAHFFSSTSACSVNKEPHQQIKEQPSFYSVKEKGRSMYDKLKPRKKSSTQKRKKLRPKPMQKRALLFLKKLSSNSAGRQIQRCIINPAKTFSSRTIPQTHSK